MATEESKNLQATASESVDAVLKLTRGIMEYESDTFWGPDVTAGEASRMALLMIDNLTQDLGFNIDGVMLSAVLDQVRAE